MGLPKGGLDIDVVFQTGKREAEERGKVYQDFC